MNIFIPLYFFYFLFFPLECVAKESTIGQLSLSG